MSLSSSIIKPAADAISNSLVTGSPLRAVGGLWAIASLVVVPLTLKQQSYSFSVGYGFSVAIMVCCFVLVSLFSVLNTTYICPNNSKQTTLTETSSLLRH